MIAGDLVAGQSTVVIDPPEGDMSDYLDSLSRLLGLAPQTLYPAHGQVIAGGPAALAQLLAHRREREEKVLEALRAVAGAASPSQLVPLAYAELAQPFHPLAEREPARAPA